MSIQLAFLIANLNNMDIMGCKNAPITWFSKCQNTIESATFRNKFVALHICNDMVVALHYKLWMFGVLLEGSANVVYDNQGVAKNSSLPEFTLTKKHN
eukprot:13085741-Ditylum_brightwellii.AAC.1